MRVIADKRPNIVFYHHPDAVDTGRERLMGRHVAGEGFLRGFVRHSGVDSFVCTTRSEEHFDDFRDRVAGWDEGRRPSRWIPFARPGEIADTGCLFVPGPGLGSFAWRRRAVGQRLYSLCGVTHTIASDNAMDAVGALLTTPVQRWDAVVCTSRAVRATVRRLLDGWAEFLEGRGGGTVSVEPQLPVIPLGVDCDAFADSEDPPGWRGRLRQRHGIGDDDIAVLFMGRLSFHAKAHPLPLYLGIEEAARRSGRRVHLIQAGWFANEGIERQFREGAAVFCPSVRVLFLDGRDDEVRRRIWFAADVFASLSDNIQETFGLAPIEAMAAALPVVVTDWDGYRDTVRHGVDGFMVPTWLPPGGAGGDLATLADTDASAEERDRAYNHYCGAVSQTTAVDLASTVEAFAALFGDRDLRRRMGQAGRRRALDRFDWRVVVAAYQTLWDELAELRTAEAELAPPSADRPLNPLRDDPFSLFAAYPTQSLRDDTQVALAPGAGPERLARVHRLNMNRFAFPILLTGGERQDLLDRLAAGGPLAVAELADKLGPERRSPLLRTLGWLAKMGMVTLTNAESGVDLFGVPGEYGAAPAAGDEAARQWRRRLAADPWDVEALAGRGRQARADGDAATAVRFFDKALERDPDHAAVNTELGELLAAGGDLGPAADCFHQALCADPTLIAAHRNLGKVQGMLGREGAAAAIFRRALRLAPGDAELWFLLGATLRRVGDAKEALACLETSIDLDRGRPDSWCHLALARKTLGRAGEALQAFYAALRFDPGNVFALAGEASLAVEDEGRRRLIRDGTARRVAMHLEQRSHYALLRPLFDAFAERHWPLLSVDARELAEFGPDVVLISDVRSRALRNQLPAAVFVYVAPGLLGADARADIALAADHVCARDSADRDALVAAGVPVERIWVTGDTHSARAVATIVARVENLGSGSKPIVG